MDIAQRAVVDSQLKVLQTSARDRIKATSDSLTKLAKLSVNVDDKGVVADWSKVAFDSRDLSAEIELEIQRRIDDADLLTEGLHEQLDIIRENHDKLERYVELSTKKESDAGLTDAEVKEMASLSDEITDTFIQELYYKKAKPKIDGII